MSKTQRIGPYKKEGQTSYASGSFVVIELLKTKPELVEKVFIHSLYKEKERLVLLCRKAGVPVSFGDDAFRRLNEKENTYVLAEFRKYACRLKEDTPHVVLVNPSDMGNLGTIVRTLTAFCFNQLAIISPCADIFNPKTVRASMGALFHMEFELFDAFGQYQSRFPKHALFPFMLEGMELGVRLNTLSDNTLSDSGSREAPLFSLIFGNEASGLDQSFARIGSAVKIPQSVCVDSLNLSIAVGIGAYAFADKYGIMKGTGKVSNRGME